MSLVEVKKIVAHSMHNGQVLMGLIKSASLFIDCVEETLLNEDWACLSIGLETIKPITGMHWMEGLSSSSPLHDLYECNAT